MEVTPLLWVPVVSSTGKPLMPCHPARARELVQNGRAKRQFRGGLFHIKLVDRIDGAVQPVACGIDPGSKKEGYTVKSEKKTFINMQADAVDWVKDAVEVRRNMRRARRARKTPCRANRNNRSVGGISPSTKARWQWKLRVARLLARLYPISVFVVEDVKARPRGRREWDENFSPIQIGKKFFYVELLKHAQVVTKRGWETKQMRDALGLKKTGNKISEVFEAHCVDSWVLAFSAVGGTLPDSKRIFCITPLRFHRRQLHRFQSEKGGIRRLYGGSRSVGFKRGSTVKHPKWGVCFVGGTMRGKISLHSFSDGRRLCQKAKPSECKFLAYTSFRTRLLSEPRHRIAAW